MAVTEASDEDLLVSINVTPLVDIFLVLLIIFMIASTILNQTEIPVNLPKAAHAGSEAPKACGLTVDRDNRLYLNDILMDSSQVAEMLRQFAATDSLYHVLISADEDLPYRRVIGLIDMVRASGIGKYALKVMRPQ